MKKPYAALLGALVLASLPIVASPASAEVCGNVGGPIGEGAAILGSVAVADAVDEWHQRLRGQPPCFTPQGVPYYTPGDMPCA